MPSFHLLYKHLSNCAHLRMGVFIQMLKYLTWQVCKYLWAAKHQSMLALCCTSWQGLLVWVKLLANAGRLLHPKWHDCSVTVEHTDPSARLYTSCLCLVKHALSLHGFLWNIATFTFTNNIVKNTKIRLREIFNLRWKARKIIHDGIGMLQTCWNRANWTKKGRERAGLSSPALHRS